jgi:hypothetical protein
MGRNRYSQYKDIPHICYACGTTKTTLNGNGKPNWFLNLTVDKKVVGMLCHKCYSSIIRVPMLTSNGFYKEYIRFKDRQIKVGRVRTGLCMHCGKNGYTHLHHEEYDETDVMKHTIELCPSCHVKESWKLGAYSNKVEKHRYTYYLNKTLNYAMDLLCSTARRDFNMMALLCLKAEGE